MPEKMSPAFRIAVGTDPNTQVIGPAVHGRAADYHHIRVFWGAIHNAAASDKQGSPVYDKVLQIRHLYPGSGDYLDVAVKRWPVDGGEPVMLDQARYDRYREVLERFEHNAKQTAQGTPIAVLNLDPHQVSNLGGKGIETVEQLADVPDVNLGFLGLGGRTERDRARAFIEATAGNAPLARMQAENDGLRADLDAMRNRVADLMQTREDAKHVAETRSEARADEAKAQYAADRKAQPELIRSPRSDEGRAQPQHPGPISHRAEPQQQKKA